MQKSLSFIVSGGFAVTLLALAGRSAVSAGQSGALVRLQTTTPGTAQTGHANVTGTIRAGQFVGGGAGLTALNAGQVTSGVLSNARIPNPLILSNSGTIVMEATTTSSTLGAVAIRGTATNTGSIVYGIWGNSESPAGRGVFGWNQAATGNAVGTYGRSDSTTGRGVYGLANSSSGINYGVFGESNSISGSGVYGLSEDSFGVQGEATATTGFNIGVYGISASTGGRGVYGFSEATSGTTYGVYGQASSSSGYGVFGGGPSRGILAQSTGSTGIPIGLYARANNASNEGIGALGETTAPNGYGLRGSNLAVTGGLGIGVRGDGGVGVYGEGLGVGLQGVSYYNTGVYGFGQNEGVLGRGTRGVTGSIGVHGQSQNADGIGVLGSFHDVGGTTGGPFYGIYGLVDVSGDRALIGDSDITSGTAYGVFGDTDGVGYAVYASGDFAVSGTKAFRIDHPLDPDHKYLMHYCTEGPEPLNSYSGTVTTKGDGYAWVELPNYFAEINRDIRYQLTVVDESGEFTMAIVSKKVNGNRFQIRTSKPGVEVSWEVKGVRNDRYVQRYGAPVEVDKPMEEQGVYEHPELYGLGREKAFPHDQPKGLKKKKALDRKTP